MGIRDWTASNAVALPSWTRARPVPACESTQCKSGVAYTLNAAAAPATIEVFTKADVVLRANHHSMNVGWVDQKTSTAGCDASAVGGRAVQNLNLEIFSRLSSLASPLPQCSSCWSLRAECRFFDLSLYIEDRMCVHSNRIQKENEEWRFFFQQSTFMFCIALLSSMSQTLSRCIVSPGECSCCLEPLASDLCSPPCGHVVHKTWCVRCFLVIF